MSPIAPDHNHRDAGLVRAVGTGALAAALVNIIIGAGSFNVPAAMAAARGVYAALGFVVCGIAMGAIAICFAEGGSRIPSSGGAYGYIDAAFGRLAGCVTGNLLWFSGVLACGGVAAALAPAPRGCADGAGLAEEIVGIATLVGLFAAVYGVQAWRRAPQPEYERV